MANDGSHKPIASVKRAREGDYFHQQHHRVGNDYVCWLLGMENRSTTKVTSCVVQILPRPKDAVVLDETEALRIIDVLEKSPVFEGWNKAHPRRVRSQLSRCPDAVWCASAKDEVLDAELFAVYTQLQILAKETSLDSDEVRIRAGIGYHPYSACVLNSLAFNGEVRASNDYMPRILPYIRQQLSAADDRTAQSDYQALRDIVNNREQQFCVPEELDRVEANAASYYDYESCYIDNLPTHDMRVSYNDRLHHALQSYIERSEITRNEQLHAYGSPIESLDADMLEKAARRRVQEHNEKDMIKRILGNRQEQHVEQLSVERAQQHQQREKQ